MADRMRYAPNPAHKSETTEAGPPRWRPNKALCPRMSVDERARLLAASIAENPRDPRSVRYTFRRGAGAVEFFAARWTREVDGEQEFHGYPTSHVPGSVLKKLRDRGDITEPEYNRLRKDLG